MWELRDSRAVNVYSGSKTMNIRYSYERVKVIANQQRTYVPIYTRKLSLFLDGQPTQPRWREYFQPVFEGEELIRGGGDCYNNR